METKKESEILQQQYSQLAHDAGNKAYFIKCQQADLEDIYVKMRNVNLDYGKAVEAEKKAEAKTAKHITEATTTEGATQ